MPEESYLYATPLGQLLLKIENDYLKEVSFKNELTTPATNNLIQASPLLTKTISTLDKYFSGEDLALGLPVKQVGTAFQQQVWKALLNIQPGFTESYLGLSKAIGNPKAVRAVGAANGKNNIALVVPCHRIIGNNGKLVGYASGLWRKSWLLQHEAKYCQRKDFLF